MASMVIFVFKGDRPTRRLRYRVLTWLSGGCLVFLLAFFPETSSTTILYHRTMRLRRLTGNQELKTQAMIDSAHLSAGDLAKEYLWRPMVLLFDPILLIYNTYLALIYGMSRISSSICHT
jgi:DHA1 family multidrug resistance protein-like MFS transporter